MHSIEGVAQGDPLEMTAFSIGILLIIKSLKQDLPSVSKPWHDDNAGALGTF